MTRSQQKSLLQLLAFVVLSAALVVGLFFIWQKHLELGSRLEDINRRHARLQGIVAKESLIIEQAKLVQQGMEGQAYQSGMDATQAGNDAQQKIRSAFTEQQITLESIQVLPPKSSSQFDKISIRLLANGTLPNFVNALIKLQDQRPPLLVESAGLQTQGTARASTDVPLVGQFDFYTLRIKPQ